MKKFLAILAGCAVLLTACSGSKPRPIPVDVPPPVEQKNDTLKIFYTDYNNIYCNMLDAAVVKYNQQFPDKLVQVEKCTFEDPQEVDNAYQKMITEFMAGDGPDLVYVNAMDMEKMARNGAFADMEPFFQADNYDWSDFNQAVMDGGVWEGKRLAIPLSYSLPILYTSASALAETGFSVENCGNYQGFLDEVEKAAGNSGQRNVFRTLIKFRGLMQGSGIKFLDYDAGTVDFSSPEIKKSLELYQEFQASIPLVLGDGDGISGAADIRDGTVLWTYPLFPMHDYILTAGAIKTFDEPVLLPVRDMEGGIRAEITDAVVVRNSSENLQNAYEFLKILLSEEMDQQTLMWRWETFSVRNSTNYAWYESDVTDRKGAFIEPGTAGFDDIVPPTPEEFEELMGYAKEVTAAYFPGRSTNFASPMSDYLNGEASYDQAMKEAQRQLEIYLSE